MCGGVFLARSGGVAAGKYNRRLGTNTLTTSEPFGILHILAFDVNSVHLLSLDIGIVCSSPDR